MNLSSFRKSHSVSSIFYILRNLNQSPLPFFCQNSRKNLCLTDNNRVLQCLSQSTRFLLLFFLSCTVSAISPHLPLILLSVNLFISDQRRAHDPNLPAILSSTHWSHWMRQYAATSANEPCPNLLFIFSCLKTHNQRITELWKQEDVAFYKEKVSAAWTCRWKLEPMLMRRLIVQDITDEPLC